MKLKEFFNYNNICPICNNKLSFFMQWNDLGLGYTDKLFIASRDNSYFEEHPANVKQLGLFGQKVDSKKIIVYLDNDNISFNSKSSEDTAKEQEIHFYALCNPDGISSLGGSYTINLYHACYYRSTPIFKFKDKLIPFSDVLSRDENFCIKTKKNGLNKIYMVSISHEENKTNLWYYTATDQENNNENYIPSILDLELPFLFKPDFSDKNKLASKFDAWILLG